MTEHDPLVITDTLVIPRSELQYRATRAGGAGGQHVNTSSTRIELLWDFERSPGISEEARDRLREKLSARLDANGMVRVVASNQRSQLQNRGAAERRLVELVKRALIVARPRRATKPSRASKEQRLSEKKRRGERKKDRRRGPDED